MPEALRQALAKAAGVDEFIISEKRWDRARRELAGTRDQESSRGRELEGQIFTDGEFGRGQSRFTVSVSASASLFPLIQESTARALTAIGPPWRLRPPSAPARLQISDSDWARSPSAATRALEEKLRSSLPDSLTIVSGHIEVQRTNTRAIVSNGFDNEYRETSAQLYAQLRTAGGKGLSLRLHARRGRDFAWQEAIEDATQQTLAPLGDGKAEFGPCDLLLMSSAYSPKSSTDFGLWTPLVRQSSADLAAAGMARYRLGQEILNKPAIGETLTMASDGTLDFALRSAPFDKHGQAVRRFPLVDDGRAAGQSVGYRDAGRLGLDANGGVRNLVVASGKKSIAELLEPRERPLLVVHSLSELHSEARGSLCLRIERAEWRTRSKAGVVEAKAVNAGVVCGNLYRWLHDARFSKERDDQLWYRGPQAIRFDQLRLHP